MRAQQQQQHEGAVAVRLDRLPEPDGKGNFWLGTFCGVLGAMLKKSYPSVEQRTTPAIFRIAYHASEDRGRFMVCPRDLPVPFDPATGRILSFATPQEALEWLRGMAARKGARAS